MRLRQIGSGYFAIAFSLLSPTGYFMYNIKEYYMGEYYLPFINPVSEGAILEFFVNAYFALHTWEELGEPVLYGFTRGHVYVSFFIIFQIYQNIEMFIEIITAKKYARPMIKSKFYKQFSSYFVLVILCLILAFVSPNDIVYNPTDGPRSICYIIIFGSAYIVLHLITGHLCNKEFYPYSTAPFVITLTCLVISILTCIFAPQAIMPYEWYIYYSIAAYLVINCLLVFRSIVKQMETHFGIKTFDIRAQLKKE
jgi:hypothetical protein